MTPTFTEPLDFYAALCCSPASLFVDFVAISVAVFLLGVLVGHSFSQKDGEDA
jgi:hypothetical protein